MLHVHTSSPPPPHYTPKQSLGCEPTHLKYSPCPGVHHIYLDVKQLSAELQQGGVCITVRKHNNDNHYTVDYLDARGVGCHSDPLKVCVTDWCKSRVELVGWCCCKVLLWTVHLSCSNIKRKHDGSCMATCLLVYLYAM